MCFKKLNASSEIDWFKDKYDKANKKGKKETEKNFSKILFIIKN